MLPLALALAFPPVFDHLWFFYLYLFVEAAAFVPLASTPYVAYLGRVHPPLAVAAVGALGTASGSLVQYALVRWLVRRPGRLPARLERWRAKLEALMTSRSGATFWTPFVIYATPLGAGPLKLMAAAAGY